MLADDSSTRGSVLAFFAGRGEKAGAPAIAGRGTDQRAVIEGLIEKDRPDPASAVIDGGWKLLLNSRGPRELYHSDEDTMDAHDLLAQDPAQATRLLAVWEEWKRQTPLTKRGARQLTPSEKRSLRALGYVDN